MAEEVTVPPVPPANEQPTAPVPPTGGPDIAALQAELENLKSQLSQVTQKESAWQQEREMLIAGVMDAEAQEIAALFYNRVPAAADGTKPSFTSWLNQRDSLPKAVLAYLPQSQAPAPQSTAPVQQPQQQVVQAPPTPQPPPAPSAPPAPPRMPDPNAGAGGIPNGQSAFSSSAINSMSVEEYAKSRQAILASLGRR